MTAAEILRNAADLLEKHGWRQGSFGANGSSHCALGALGETAGCLYMGTIDPHQPNYTNYIQARTQLRKTIGLDPRKSGIAMWNDAPTRTQNEVTQALRTAAREASITK